jgi:hypothetical protein
MYPITKRAKETGLNTIKNILHNNEYNTNLIRNQLSHKSKIYTLFLSGTTKQNGSPLHAVAKR